MTLSSSVKRKFVDVKGVSGFKVMTSSGFRPITHSNKTVRYAVYLVRLKNGFTLECADKHILIKSNGEEVFAKNSLGQMIDTKIGPSEVVDVVKTERREHMYDLTVDSKDHTYYTNGICSHNTTATGALINHFHTFNKNKEIGVLANKKGQATEIVNRIRNAFEMLPFFLKPAAKTYNKNTVVLENGSTVFAEASTSSSVRGRSIAFLYIDEAAHIMNDEEFFESTYPTISSSKTARMVITSTPRGRRGLFYRLWEQADPKNNTSMVRLLVKWWENPTRDKEWYEKTLATQGPAKFDQEFNCSFRSSSGSLLDPKTQASLESFTPIDESLDFREYASPIDGHTYIAVVDTSLGLDQDSQVITIIDVSTRPFNVAYIYESNTINPMLFPTKIKEVAERYNNAYVFVELNNGGFSIPNDLFYNLGYERILRTRKNKKGQLELVLNGSSKFMGIQTTSSTKNTGCSNIKVALSRGKIRVNDYALIEQFGTFVAHKETYRADKGAHDDLVMTMVLFGWLLDQKAFHYLSNSNIRSEIQNGSVNKDMSNDRIPATFLVSNNSSDVVYERDELDEQGFVVVDRF